MRSFSEYVHDKSMNKLYYGAMQYAIPGYFMSFTEAEWNTRTGQKLPNGVVTYPILETKDYWADTDYGKIFSKAATPQDKLFILKAKHVGSEYTKEQFLTDVELLEKKCDFKTNNKLVKNMLQRGLFEEAQKEKEKFKNMVLEATKGLTKPDEMLWEITRWVAANGRNPDDYFPDNAYQRWNNTLRKLNMSAIEKDDITIFLDVNEFEVIDEIHN